MSGWLIAACGVAYVYVAVEQALRGEWAIATLYGGYALANVGACIIAVNGVK